MFRKTCCTLVFMAATGLVAKTFATPIQFTHRGVGRGTLHNTVFFETPFTIMAIGDTASREPGLPHLSVWSIDHSSAQIEIEEMGTFTFTTPTRTFVHTETGAVGFSGASVRGLDLFNGPRSEALSDWNMLTSIGPISGVGLLIQWQAAPIRTSAGLLHFEFDANVPATFQAVIIPEPSSIALAAICLLIAGRPKAPIAPSPRPGFEARGGRRLGR